MYSEENISIFIYIFKHILFNEYLRYLISKTLIGLNASASKKSGRRRPREIVVANKTLIPVYQYLTGSRNLIIRSNSGCTIFQLMRPTEGFGRRASQTVRLCGLKALALKDTHQPNYIAYVNSTGF